MYYSIYANERLAIQNWDYYNECNWLLMNFITKHYEMDVDDMVDFYLTHRHERFTEEDSYVEWSANELLHLYEEWKDYQNRKFYYEDYMEELEASGEDADEYENSYMCYVEFQYSDYFERISRFFTDKSFIKKLKSGEKVSLKLYDWLKEDDEEIGDKFDKRVARNKRMNTKLREVNEVVFYKSDFEAIEKAKRDFRLTELQTQVVFGLIFMSRMNGVKYCRIGTTYKNKGFFSSFDKHISVDDCQKVWKTGLFEDDVSDKSKTRRMLNNRYGEGYADYLHIEDYVVDKIYLNFDNQDEVAWVFHTTVENNRLNFSQICKEAMPNLKNKYCSVCGKEFTPNSNSQKQCTECRDKYKKEQARLRKQKQRAKK